MPLWCQCGAKCGASGAICGAKVVNGASMSDQPKYTQAFVREIMSKSKARNGRTKLVHKAWKGVLKYKVDNPDYLERPEEGADTRTPSQKRRQIWKQAAQTFDPETVKTKSEALQALEDWRRLLERKDLPGSNSTVGEYVSSFIDDLEASSNVERRTASEYRTTAKRIAEGFKGVALKDLTPAMIQKWENGLTRKGLAPATVLKYHRLLSEVCKHAVNVRDLDWNPCTPVKTPKRAASSPNALTSEGYARLSATLDAMEPTPVVVAAAIAMHAGLRQGEVCGLRWRDYDRDAATISVNESIGKASGTNYVKAPKTKSSRRNVPVSPQLARVLDRRRAAMVEELQAGDVDPTAIDFGALYVVGYIDGRFHSPALIGRGWKALSNAFGLTGTQGRPITFHDLRHSFATRAIAAGADVKAVAAVLGHTNAAITLNVYADADPESKRRATSLVSGAIAAYGEVEPYAEIVEPE